MLAKEIPDQGHRLGDGGSGSGPWRTSCTKCWMQELGVKKNHVLAKKDYLFEYGGQEQGATLTRSHVKRSNTEKL